VFSSINSIPDISTGLTGGLVLGALLPVLAITALTVHATVVALSAKRSEASAHGSCCAACSTRFARFIAAAGGDADGSPRTPTPVQ